MADVLTLIRHLDSQNLADELGNLGGSVKRTGESAKKFYLGFPRPETRIFHEVVRASRTGKKLLILE